VPGFDDSLDYHTDNQRVLDILEEAFEIQTRSTPFIGFTGKICPAPCESSCTNALDNNGNGKPVQIKKIEEMMYELGVKHNWFDEQFIFNGISTQKKVIIVGSGPAGLQAAYDLR